MALLDVGRTHLEIEAEPEGGGAVVRQRVGEVRTWSDSSTTSKTDISRIGDLDANGRPLKRWKAGAVENQQTLSVFYDPEDYVQSLLRPGFKFARGFVVEITDDRTVYNDCEVLSWTKNGQEFDGLVGADLTITVNGDIED